MTTNTGTALVTGASSGIGKAFAQELARRGHDLVIVSRDAERLDALAAGLRDDHAVAVEVCRADLTDAGDVARVAGRISSDPRLDRVVNCAGLWVAGPVLGGETRRYAPLMAVNVVALQELTLAAAAAFAARGRGGITNISSAVVMAPQRFHAVYVAGKAYVLALTEALQGEVAGSGVRLQAVLPGFTKTELFDRAGADVSAVPDVMKMAPGLLVEAALAGFEAGETVTIPSLPDLADWNAFLAARAALEPNLSHDRPAPRYRLAEAV
ncbi:SDR family oxidoreductase [Acuticoccus sp. I52.16.1]|uniref:SDR family NAD(P)-dependent oxidoreductase n=1 Tax=Acuticoccus sp. I52.16.1 TaxID=2928472 RepID=UPI001FD0F24A|nr:SDR family NAD(P)-dependent oxidoreductase [Acuticoccus sp. I52.16.1]UOM36593.1 SDR family NAD(P)-dependent oxidoreductase [Acuticoccus sp. I52.16.1]